MPGLMDWVLIVGLFVILPLFERADHERASKRIRSGVPGARLALFNRIALLEWAALAVVLALVLGRGFGPDVFGLVQPPFRRTVLAGLLAAGVLWAVRWQLGRVAADPVAREQVMAAVAPIAQMVPESDADARAGVRLSVTAGVVEELLFRGYLISVFAALMPVWGAVLASSVLFGWVHLYQGPSGVLRTGLVGLALAGLYLLAGSIWIPMFFHAGFDMVQLSGLRRIVHGPSAAAPSNQPDPGGAGGPDPLFGG